jgi:hypothetical protein
MRASIPFPCFVVVQAGGAPAMNHTKGGLGLRVHATPPTAAEGDIMAVPNAEGLRWYAHKFCLTMIAFEPGDGKQVEIPTFEVN